MSIGNNIKKLREREGMTQFDLANRIGVSDKTISSWEINRTEPKMGTIEKICSVLHCKKTDIIGCDFDYAYYPDDSESPLIIEINNEARNMDSSSLNRLLEYARLLNNQKEPDK